MGKASMRLPTRLLGRAMLGVFFIAAAAHGQVRDPWAEARARMVEHEIVAGGAWQIAGQSEAVDSDGDRQGRGRLVGVLMKDYQLGPEFELGTKGSFQLDADGDLYLRCRNTWNELAGDRGHVAVKFQLQGQGSSLCEADGEGRAGHRATCRSASRGGQ